MRTQGTWLLRCRDAKKGQRQPARVFKAALPGFGSFPIMSSPLDITFARALDASKRSNGKEKATVNKSRTLRFAD